jgi:serine/threonine protein kinase
MLGSLYVRYESLSELEEIGAGGFATVHRAKYTHVNGMTQMVAVKQLLKSRLNSKQDLNDFIAVRSNHDHACTALTNDGIFSFFV